MTQPTKREQLAAMRLEEFKAHLRTIAGGSRNKSAAHRVRIRCWCAIARRQREARRNEGADYRRNAVAMDGEAANREAVPLFEIDRVLVRLTE